MAKKCFVISPIGPSGSETRQHTDDVFEFIIKPAKYGLAAEAPSGRRDR